MNESITALQETAKKHFQKKEYTLAADLFEKCAKLAAETNDVLSEAEMRNNLSVSLLMAGQAHQALDAVKGTELVFAEHNDIKRQAMAYGNIGAAFEDLKDYEQSLTAYEKADELLKSINENELRSVMLKHKASVQSHLGDKFVAVATLDSAYQSTPHPTFKEKIMKRFFNFLFTTKK